MAALLTSNDLKLVVSDATTPFPQARSLCGAMGGAGIGREAFDALGAAEVGISKQQDGLPGDPWDPCTVTRA